MSNVNNLSGLSASISGGAYDNAFAALYPGRGAPECRERFLSLIDLCGRNAVGRVVIVSAPGRAEICGNHTDHQRGKVLAAAVDQDIICVAATNGSNRIRVKSVGFPGEVDVSLDDTGVRDSERGSDAALIRGLAAWFKARGAGIEGFDAYTTSNVPVGSGLSSSAAFEVVIGTAMNVLFGSGFSQLDIAIAGKFAENEYFGKPSGLMDQTASSVGGFVSIDFADPQNPIVEPIRYDPSESGLSLCVVHTKGSHANLIDEYASIPEEMRAVSSFFGKNYLREVNEAEFYANVSAIRDRLRGLQAGDQRGVAADRSILRAIHFFNENRRVAEAAEALRAADAGRFLDCVARSGQSSFTYLQNIYTASNPGEQGLSLALALSESVLGGTGGAWRVHGGGFAGTIMAFVPDALHEKYVKTLGAVFGDDAVITLSIRKYGGVEVTPDI